MEITYCKCTIKKNSYVCDLLNNFFVKRGFLLPPVKAFRLNPPLCQRPADVITTSRMNLVLNIKISQIFASLENHFGNVSETLKRLWNRRGQNYQPNALKGFLLTIC
jgi:hypothetical protein